MKKLFYVIIAFIAILFIAILSIFSMTQAVPNLLTDWLQVGVMMTLLVIGPLALYFIFLLLNKASDWLAKKIPTIEPTISVLYILLLIFIGGSFGIFCRNIWLYFFDI